MKTCPFPLLALMLAFGGTVCAQTTTPVVTEPNPWNLDVGLNYVTGDYGLNRDTDVWVQTTSLGYEKNPWRFEATLPFISLSGPASVIGDVGRADTSTQRGAGDISVAATYQLVRADAGRGNIDFTARLKLPTADEDKGLGTGETDLNVEFNYSRNLGEVTPFATLGYRFLGRSPAYPLKDGFYTTMGLAAPVGTNGTTAGLALTWRAAIVEDADSATELMAFVSRRLDENWKIQGFVLTGFTDASPDFGLGALVGYKF